MFYRLVMIKLELDVWEYKDVLRNNEFKMHITAYLEDEVHVKHLDWLWYMHNDYLHRIYPFWPIIIGWIVADWKYPGINPS